MIRGFQKLGVPLWGPDNKDCSILEVYVGVPSFGETTLLGLGSTESSILLKA